MQELREQAKTNVDSIVATVAGILSVVALIIAIGAMARTPEPDALTRAEAQEMIDSAVMRVADPAAYTQRVVQEAIDRYDAEGREASIAYHSSRESIDGPWYVFLLDENGYVLANPARPDFVGTTPAVRSDITGKPYGLDVVAADEDGRWVDYVFVNPSTGEPERKHTWVIKHDGLSFASGWYEPISREDDPATWSPRRQRGPRRQPLRNGRARSDPGRNYGGVVGDGRRGTGSSGQCPEVRLGTHRARSRAPGLVADARSRRGIGRWVRSTHAR